MRIGNMFLAALAAALATSLFTGASRAAGGADAVAVQYHFAGAADLARNTNNFGRADKIFSLPPAKRFVDLVLDRWAGLFWNDFQFGAGGDSVALLRPMIEDLLQAESAGSFGGRDKNRMDFVLAARLNATSANAWQKNLETALHGQGEPLTEAGFSGRRWNRPGQQAFWIVRARDWVVAGRGEDLLPVRAQYLQNIKQDNRPAPVAHNAWLSAQVDWPLLATWAPLSNCPFRLARTSLEVTAANGLFKATNYVTYPEAIPWVSQPWRIPKELVGSPLSSFTASRDLAAYLSQNQTLSRLAGNPLTNQLFCWASRELALLNYAAWPVANASNALRKLGDESPAILNPILQARHLTQLSWSPKKDHLLWDLPPITVATVQATNTNSGDFLLAKLFSMEPAYNPASDQLWAAFQDRTDMVYYDWELTGPRLLQWRLLTELLPVFPKPTPADNARYQAAAKNAKPPVLPGEPRTPLDITEWWLSELTPALGNTVTTVTRTSPTELTVVRSSSFLLTGLELVLLSHWLADAPVGPIDYSLLPQAKMSGPGLPKRH
jgi:hypothetical protein